MNNTLWELGGPPLLVVDADSRFDFTTLVPPSGSLVVARLDGAAMGTDHDVFAQFAAAWAFPDYFGWNWNAWSDCVEDLSWYPAQRYLVVIEHAEQALASDPEGRAYFLARLARAVRFWADPVGKADGAGVPFKVVLLTAHDAVDAVLAELVRPGVQGG